MLLAFGARVNPQNAYSKTPLDLVEGPWRFFSRTDSNHASGSFSKELSLDVYTISEIYNIFTFRLT